MPIFEESPKVELKRKVNADFKKEIIAFANTDGDERQRIHIASEIS